MLYSKAKDKKQKLNPMRIIQSQYQEVFQYLHAHRQWCWLTMLLIAELILFVCLKTGPDAHYESYVENTIGKYPNLFTFILGENIQSALVMISFGFLPFGLGVIFGTYSVFSSLCSTVKWLLPDYGVRKILLGIMAHGIFELTALCFSVLLSVLLCRALTLSILRLIQRQPLLNEFRTDLLFLVRAVFIVLIPLLFIAASVEVTITAWIVGMLD